MNKEAYERAITQLMTEAADRLTGTDYRSLVESISRYCDNERIEAGWDDDHNYDVDQAFGFMDKEVIE